MAIDRCDGVVKAETVAVVQHIATIQEIPAAEILIVKKICTLNF